MVRERAQELKLWNGLELKLRRWMDNSAEEFKRLGEEAYTALIGQDYASYKTMHHLSQSKHLHHFV